LTSQNDSQKPRSDQAPGLLTSAIDINAGGGASSTGGPCAPWLGAACRWRHARTRSWSPRSGSAQGPQAFVRGDPLERAGQVARLMTTRWRAAPALAPWGRVRCRWRFRSGCRPGRVDRC